GPTGVELVGSLAQLAKVTLRGNFRRIDPAKASIILLDASKRVLPTFAESVSRKVTRRLEKLGVKVLTGVKVETVDEQGVIAGGKRIERDGAVDRGGRGIAGSKDARYQNRPRGTGARRPVPEGRGRTRRVRRRRRGVDHAKRISSARRGAGSDSGRAVRRAVDRERAEEPG